MNILDFILLTLLAIALIRGLVRGMIRQVAGLLGLITGFVVAGHLYLRLLPALRRYFPSAPFLEILSYIVIYGATWFAVVFLGYLFVKLSRAMLMAWADRLLGGILGLFKGMVAAVVLVAVLTLFLPDDSDLLKESFFSVHVQRAGYLLVKLTPKDLRDRYGKRHEALVRQLQQQQITDSIKKKIKQ
jgi:membrane protein required for colicin V production